MKQLSSHIFTGCLLAGLLFSVASCGGNRPKVLYEHSQSDTILTIGIRSPAVNKGLLEKDRVVPLYIVLPESYASSGNKRYPVVYALHGFGDTPQGIVTALAGAVRSGGVADVIVIGIDGSCDLFGSFWANSPVSGNWEDALVDEIVPLIDRKYRTIGNPSGRILAGFSMGGFGAWKLGLKHPDTFSSFWACCPGAWDEKGQRDTLAGWQDIYRKAYGAVYAPDLDLPHPYGHIPSFDGTFADAKIQEAWEDGFGGIRKKLSEYRAHTARLTVGVFAYGDRDDFRWIPRGTRYIAENMAAAGIPVEIREFHAGHRLTSEMMSESFVPLVRKMFFSSGK